MGSRLQAIRDQRDDLLNIDDGYFDSCLLVPFERSLFDLASLRCLGQLAASPSHPVLILSNLS
jgi:hypothetical protein